MFWRYSRVPRWVLWGLAIVGLALTALVEFTLHEEKMPYFEEKLRAAMLAQTAQQTIRNWRAGRDIATDERSDPNGTGLIGEEFTLITTDQGNLDAKLTATNPNFAAVIVDMLKQAGVKRGDYIAVAYTGSFPGANIAVLSALEVLGAKPIIISSVGSSMWGANNPDLTYLDMERILNEKDILHFRSIAASLGGKGDYGGNISPQGREMIRRIIERNGVRLIEEPTLSKNIRDRMNIYKKNLPAGEKYAAYINVGGGLASLGSSQNKVLLDNGFIKHIPRANYPRRGTMIKMGLKGVPAINILQINEIARRYKLPIAPVPLPDPPSGGVFFRNRYNIAAVWGIVIFYVVLIAVALRTRKRIK